MGLRDLRKQSTANFVNQVVNKSKKLDKPKTTVKKGGSQYDKVKALSELVQQKLGYLADSFENIFEKERLKQYIDNAIINGYIALDTETTGLDPITDKLVGACIYTPGEKPAYIPINHVSLITNQRLSNQLTNEQVAEEFVRLVDNNVRIIFFNAKFDIRVLKNQLGIEFKPYWDGFIAGKVLKENEEEGNLKYLWKKYCSPDKEAEHFTFDKLFKGYSFDLFPIKTAYLYAAKDAIMTWELFKFQEPYLTPDNPRCIECGFEKLASLYHNIEMPVINFVAEIEDNGVSLDLEYSKKLSEKYNKLLQEKESNFYLALEEYKDKIIQFMATHPNHKVRDPLNISSPAQLAELFYDILQVGVISKKEPRGTGEEILEKMNHPLCKPILEYRGVKKLLTTYIDKLPQILNSKTKRIHCSFHQYGADTGRFSSSDPNLQNIPSHNKDIRPMFISSTTSTLEFEDSVELFNYDKVRTREGYKFAKDLTCSDIIIDDSSNALTIENIDKRDIVSIIFKKGGSHV